MRGDLRAGRAIEESRRVAVDLSLEGRKLCANPSEIKGAGSGVADRGTHERAGSLTGDFTKRVSFSQGSREREGSPVLGETQAEARAI